MTPPGKRLELTQAVMTELFTNHELLARERHRPELEEGAPVRRIGILGGGTAGWFTALALRAQLPSLEVTVIETPSIPIIGVGEASVPLLVSFLHHYLYLDVVEFTREVAPTWKQGIRFEWGQPGDYAFQAPFDWDVNGIGMLGSMAETDNVSAFTVQSILMEQGRVPVLRDGSKIESFMHQVSFAYHLDNERLVKFLRRTAAMRGVHHLDCKIVDAPLRADRPSDEPEIDHLLTEDGRKLDFDLYVDCSGFRSFLLGQKLGERFHSFASSLFTDSAVAFNAPHGGKLKPYTTARTMESGWCWNIPIEESDHLGYVYASSFCSDDAALAEARRTWPDLTNERVVRFRSGRHDRAWVGNVFAIGNAYAFVEPLESTGLLMIVRAITSLVRAFPIGPGSAPMRRFVNESTARAWDRLRWFLAAHYKFNARLDTPFWREVRASVDVSGIQHALDLFRTCGPLSLLPRAIRSDLMEEAGIFFYGLWGLDCILLGQKVPYPKLEGEPAERWRARHQAALEFARRSISQEEAQRILKEKPERLTELIHIPTGWVKRMAELL